MNIYSILTSKPHNSHYLRRYINFIEKQPQIQSGEIHHICPKAKDLFPEYKSLKLYAWNKIILSPRAHFIAHWILSKVYGKSQALCFWAFLNQTTPNRVNVKRNISINSKSYEIAKNKAKLQISKSKLGKPNTKNSEIKKNMVHAKNTKTNEVVLVTKEEFKRNKELVGIRKGLRNKYVPTEQYLNNLSEKMSGRIWMMKPENKNDRIFIKSNDVAYYCSIGYIVGFKSYDRSKHQKECPYCGKTCDATNYVRWHGDNCKSRNNGKIISH